MFDLEKAITEWRQEMLAAGIQTPVPLEELELHLRDEIEGQHESGLIEVEAFNAAVRNVGQGHPLQNEFSKVRTGHKIVRAVVLTVLWFAAGCALLYSLVCLEINWNLFGFSPRWDGAVPGQLVCIFGSIAGTWFLAKTSRDRFSRAMSLLICVLLAGIAMFVFFYAERFLLGRNELSPLWFRGCLTLLSCLPVIFRIWLGRRRHQAWAPQ